VDQRISRIGASEDQRAIRGSTASAGWPEGLEDPRSIIGGSEDEGSEDQQGGARHRESADQRTSRVGSSENQQAIKASTASVGAARGPSGSEVHTWRIRRLGGQRISRVVQGTENQWTRRLRL
jgi:hypothetical protein